MEMKMELSEQQSIQEEIERLPSGAEDWTAKEVLSWAFSRFGKKAAVVSGFGAEGMVVIHFAAQIHPGFSLITLDTDFLFPETYRLMGEVERRYGVTVERVRSRPPEEQEQLYGAALWSRDPDLCCRLRKVEPLHRRLADLQAWVTGIRREQSPTRAGVHKIEWDSRFGLVKLNPLADWSWADLWQFVHRHRVPYNPLHNRNYPSIGCTHCTRAVLPHEDLRAGRWAGLAKTECGLHIASGDGAYQTGD